MTVTGIWTRNPRGEWVAPPETPTDTLARTFETPHSADEKLQALYEFAMHVAEGADAPRRPQPPPAEFEGATWPPPPLPVIDREPASDDRKHE